MNNNYHTQMDKPNMLNEIAANNHLLQQQQQQQMQNFQGTPINKNPLMNPPMNTPMNPQMNQLNPPMNPQLSQQMNPQLTQQQIAYAQQLAQQAQQNGLYQQQQQINNPNPMMYPNNIYQQQQNIGQKNDNDEIELSEQPEPKPKQNSEIIAPTEDQQINKQIQQLIQNNPKNVEQSHPSMSKRDPSKMPQQMRKQLPPPQIKYVPVYKSENNMVSYIIIPLLLVVIFVILVHPKTSKILEKYLPKMDSMKGYAVRGLILAIAYVIVKFVTSSMGKKS